MKLKKILSGIRGSNTTSADLKAAHAEIDIEAAEAAVAKLENERARLLIDGTNTQIANVEQRIEAANLECERAHAMMKEIDRRIELAETAEEQVRRQKIYDAALTKKREAEAALRDYASAAEKIRECLVTLSEAELAIADANEALPDNCAPIISSEREAELANPAVWCPPLIKTVTLPGIEPSAPLFWRAISENWATPTDAAQLALRQFKTKRTAANAAE